MSYLFKYQNCLQVEFCCKYLEPDIKKICLLKINNLYFWHFVYQLNWRICWSPFNLYSLHIKLIKWFYDRFWLIIYCYSRTQWNINHFMSNIQFMTNFWREKKKYKQNGATNSQEFECVFAGVGFYAGVCSISNYGQCSNCDFRFCQKYNFRSVYSIV